MLELAEDEAGVLGHNYVGSEHVLLGLLRADEGVAGAVLDDLGITLDRMRNIVVVAGSRPKVTSGRLRFTPRAKMALELGPEGGACCR